MNEADNRAQEQSAPRMLQIILRHWRKISIGIGMTLATVSFNLTIPYISRVVIDRLTEGSLRVVHLTGFLVLYFAAALLATLFSYWMRQLPLWVGHAIEAGVRRKVFAQLTLMDRGYFRKLHTGDLMNRMSSDMRTVAMAVGQGLMQICRMVFVFAIAFTIMFNVCWQLALVMLFLVPFMSLSFAWFANRIKQQHIVVQEELSEMANFSQETFSGIQTIKAFSLEQRWRRLFGVRNDTLVGKNVKLAAVHEVIWPLASVWLALGTVTILVLGGRYVIQGRLTLGELVQFSQYLMIMQWPLLSLGWVMGVMQRGRASWMRILEVWTAQPRISDSSITNVALQELEGDIQFEQVDVVADGQTLLKNVTLRIPRGSRVGITGPTGSGKTVLVSLLPRLIDPDAGRVIIGDHDLLEYPLETLRAQIGMAEQEPVLFSDTLKKNIAFGLERQSDEKVLHAADIAHLSGDVEQFPQQYETMIGERGVTLSGGQRQRTSISRAIAREPRILVLDDVLASVDTATEAGILDRLQPVFRGRTTLFVSHRVSTLRDMDFVVVVEEGTITQCGPHQELIKQEGYYKKLCEIQELAAAVSGSDL